MIHIVYLDSRTNALELILTGKKTIIAKGSMGQRIPYKRIEEGDVMYFIESKRDREIKARAIVTKVYNSGKLTEEESYKLLDKYKADLRLSIAQYKKYAGKSYITLVSLNAVQKVENRILKKQINQNNDDWLLVDFLDGLVEV